GRTVAAGQRRLEPAPTLVQVAVGAPEPREGACELELVLGLPAAAEAVERGAQVVQLRLEHAEPDLASAPVRRRPPLDDVRLRLDRDGEEVLGMAPSHGVLVARARKPLAGVLTDRLQHPEALAPMAEQALVDERLQG